MAIITFMSDFGESDHYVAAVKAKILNFNSNLNIVDISHQIEPCNIAHGSYVLKTVFREFPKGTVHLVAVHSTGNNKDCFIALKLEDHFFVGADNGLLGLISEQESKLVVDINNINPVNSTFPAKDILALTAAKLGTGVNITELGPALEGYKKLINRQIRATKKQIGGNIIRVDHFGNLITNIDKQTFDILSKDKGFEVSFGRESFNTINRNYDSVENGECFVVFNSHGLLEIGIKQGNAAQLLGLEYDSPVMINFKERAD